jgi:hypothetical protein
LCQMCKPLGGARLILASAADRPSLSWFPMTIRARAVLVLPRAGWRETSVLLAAAWLVPVLVHVIPWDGDRPLGVYLLPVFWMTFVALYFHGALLGLLVGLVTPIANLLVTGLPAAKSVGMMSLEVAFFAVIAAWAVARWPNSRLTAPLAYVLAKAAAIMVEFVVPAFGETENPLAHLARSTQNGLAGLAVLAVINVLLVAFCPKTDAWEKE